MVAPTVGINPLSPVWIATLVVYRCRKFGCCRRWRRRDLRRADCAALPWAYRSLVALLISVEPLIIMGRTALNVSGSMTAGTLTSQWLKQITNKEPFSIAKTLGASIIHYRGSHRLNDDQQLKMSVSLKTPVSSTGVFVFLVSGAGFLAVSS